ncbi:polyprenol monophosphomannose synthase [soil metagenome]
MTAACLLVLIPTYDEVANIESLIGRLRAAVPDADILVVDDASHDGTGAVVEQMAAGDSQLHLLSRGRKQGIGAAYVAGYAWGLERHYQVFVQMDADGSHSPEQLPGLLKALTNADLVLGSRWISGGSVVNWPRRRMLLSRAGNGYTRALLALPVHDATGGFRVLRRATVERLDLQSVASAGYSFQVDVVHRAVRAGCRVVEVPISFVERERGASKMSKSVVCEALWRVTGWGLVRRGSDVRDVLSKAVRSTT